MADADPSAKATARVAEERVSAADLDDRLKTAEAPFVVRGLIADWPLVEAGRESSAAARAYLLQHRRDRAFTVNIGQPGGGDRLFYDEAMGMNFRTGRTGLADIFAGIEANEDKPDAPAIYLSSVDVQAYFDGLHEANHVDLGQREPIESIWIGTRTRIAAHNDFPDNLACCAVGKRRFTLFPPEQFVNLYVGPLDFTPAGRPVSMVDLRDPDFAAYPRFRDALKTAQVAELDPGDAIFIPSMWWHHVEALAPFNVLVNYWWRDTPRFLAQPQDALNHALLSVRDLPEDEKKLWRQMFDHYVFGDAARAAAHIPEKARGILAPLDAESAGRIRANLLPEPVAVTAWPLKRIVIAGGGTAGWMAAAAIAKTLGHAAELTLIESDMIGTIGVGESTIPPLVTYNRLLGINEAEFMRATQATFKLGIGFENWKEVGHRYFHSFGVTGQDHWSAGFQHFWLNGLDRGHDEPYDDYCLELSAAYAGKFAHLPDDRMNYAYQLDSSLYAKFLRTMAEKDGATRIEGKIAEVELDGESGDIAALKLESGQRIEGDLFIDCTGFRALLIDATLGSKFEDWTRWLLNDSAIAIQTRSVRPAAPYTLAIAHDSGWRWRIPLQHRTGNGIVFCSGYMDKDAALERLLGDIEGDTLTQPNLLRFKAGVRPRQWVRNCIVVGLSSGFMEPLESTSIHLIQRAVLRLIRMLPLADVSERDILEFNDQMMQDYVQIRDFLILHYKATDRRDSEFWRYCADMDVPDSLTQKIELFRETGRVFRRNEELFAENSWVQVMMGQGIMPKSYHPIATKLTDAEMIKLLSTIRDNVAQTVKGLPDHPAYVARYCGAANADAA